MSYKEERIIHVIKELAMQYVSRESNRTSLVTVTNIIFNSKAKRATILISVLPDSKSGIVEEFLNRNRNDFRDYVKSNSKLGIIPLFDFKIDQGEINRQNIDRMLK